MKDDELSFRLCKSDMGIVMQSLEVLCFDAYLLRSFDVTVLKPPGCFLDARLK